MKRAYIGDVLRCFVSSASVFAALALNAQTATQDYPLSFNQDTPTTAQSALQQVTLQTNRGNSALPIQKERAYNDLSNNLIASLRGRISTLCGKGLKGFLAIFTLTGTTTDSLNLRTLQPDGFWR